MSLKGHAKIELTDVNTDKAEVIEHDNDITHAMLDIFNHRGLEKCIANMGEYVGDVKASILKNWFGGIFLFNNSLESSLSDYSIPSNIDCIGYAGTGANSGTDTMRGSFNEVESYIDEQNKEAKFVWDFSTAQANGTISSLALVPTDTGDMGWECKREEFDESREVTRGYSTSFPVVTTGADCYLWYDSQSIWGIERGNLIYASPNVSTDNHVSKTGKLRFIKRSFVKFSNLISIFSNDYTWGSIQEVVEVDLPDIMKDFFASFPSNGEVRIHIEYDNGYVYFYANNSSSVSPSAPFYLLKINIKNFETELIAMTNTTNEYLSIGFYPRYGLSDPHSTFASTSYSKMRIVNENLVVIGSSQIWSIKIQDNTDIRIIRFSTGTSAIANYFKITGFKYKNYLFISEKGTSGSSYGNLNAVINIEKGLIFYIHNRRQMSSLIWKDGHDSYTYHKNFFVYSSVEINKPHLIFAERRFNNNDDSMEVYIGFNPFILMTKNNLDTPAIKTSAQTMKIVYTITESS